MASPYVYERQSEYWTSRQIEEFFLDAGFEVITFPLSQMNEKNIPADFVFFDKRRTKLFGFQYKALYSNDRDHWNISEDQHETLARFPWIYYCLSEIKQARDHRSALHLCRIVKANFNFREQVFQTGDGRLNIFNRWAGFYQSVERCTDGLLIESREHLLHVLGVGASRPLHWELTRNMVDVFLADFETRRTIHLSPQLGGEG